MGLSEQESGDRSQRYQIERRYAQENQQGEAECGEDAEREVGAVFQAEEKSRGQQYRHHCGFQPIEESRNVWVVFDTPVYPDQDQQHEQGRQKNRHGGDKRSRDPHDLETDEGRGDRNRAGSDLPQRDAINEFLTREPIADNTHFIADERNGSVSAAENHGAGLQEDAEQFDSLSGMEHEKRQRPEGRSPTGAAQDESENPRSDNRHHGIDPHDEEPESEDERDQSLVAAQHGLAHVDRRPHDDCRYDGTDAAEDVSHHRDCVKLEVQCG